MFLNLGMDWVSSTNNNYEPKFGSDVLPHLFPDMVIDLVVDLDKTMIPEWMVDVPSDRPKSLD